MKTCKSTADFSAVLYLIISAPFDLPDCWEWTTFPTVAHVELGKTLDKVKNTGTYYPYLRSVNIQWGYVDLSDVKEMKFEPEEIERYTIKKNDLLICEGGDVGRCCVWNKNESILYQNAIHRVRFYNSINCNFYMYFMMYLEAKGTLKRISNGVTIKHLTNTVLSNIFINNQLSEQMQRIVCAHELGHDQLHRNLAKDNPLREFMLYDMRTKPEYEANIVAAEILLDNDELLEYIYQYRFSAEQIARAMETDICMNGISLFKSIELLSQ